MENLTTFERAPILYKMRAAVNAFYAAATKTGNHQFVEFTGLLMEYVKICEHAQVAGIDFTNCSKHSGRVLPMEEHEVAYINEKLACIFTGRIALASTPNEPIGHADLPEPAQIAPQMITEDCYTAAQMREAIAAEKERCAKICKKAPRPQLGAWDDSYGFACDDLAAAILAS